MDSTQVVALSHPRERGQVISCKGCGRTGVLVVVRFHHVRLRSCKRARQHKRKVCSLYGRNAPYDNIGRAPTDTGRKVIQVCRLSLCCQSRDTRGLYARGLHRGHNWRTYMAGDASVRSTIRPKHPKSTTRVSAVEREKRGTLTCPCYLLGAITYGQNKTISGRRSILLCSSCLFI